jgi:hypothetical protein
MESVVLELIRMVDWQYRELFAADNINGIGGAFLRIALLALI